MVEIDGKLKDKIIKEIEKARKEILKGNCYNEEEAKKILKLKK